MFVASRKSDLTNFKKKEYLRYFVASRKNDLKL